MTGQAPESPNSTSPSTNSPNSAMIRRLNRRASKSKHLLHRPHATPLPSIGQSLCALSTLSLSVVCRFLGRTNPLRGVRKSRQREASDPKEVKEVLPPIDEQPRELPADLWNSCLQSLFLQGNQIKWLPDYLGKFSGLQRLDISGYV